MQRPPRIHPVIIDYSRDTWHFDTPSPREMAYLQPTFVPCRGVIFALYCVESLPDEWRGEAVFMFIEQLNELEAVA